MKLVYATIALALVACTTLGPMPATTGVSAVPAGRPGAQVQAGFVPGYYLSTGTQDKSHGAATPQLSALFDPDRLLPIKGFLVGARLYGQSGDTLGEPYVGYRTRLGGGAVSVGVVAYGSAKRSTNKLASYHATRFGLEAMADAQLAELSDLVAIHGQLAASATRISASGSYCADPNGFGVDCDTTVNASNTLIDGKASGVFPAGTAQLSLDLARRRAGGVHVVQVALLGATGQMPKVKSGVQGDNALYASLGVLLTFGFGAD